MALILSVVPITPRRVDQKRDVIYKSWSNVIATGILRSRMASLGLTISKVCPSCGFSFNLLWFRCFQKRF